MTNFKYQNNLAVCSVISLTGSLHLVDTRSLLIKKGRLMDEISKFTNFSHEQLVSIIAKNKDRGAFKILFKYLVKLSFKELAIKSFTINLSHMGTGRIFVRS